MLPLTSFYSLTLILVVRHLDAGGKLTIKVLFLTVQRDKQICRYSN